MEKKLYKNIINVALSNMLLVIAGIVSSFILPKVLGVTDYGYYKIFNLYTTYIVFFDIGIANGVYLKYGGYTFEELPLERMRKYFRILLYLQIFFAFLIVILACLFSRGDYRVIFIDLALYTVVNNIANYFEKISIMIGDFGPNIRRNILKSILTIFIVIISYVAIYFQIDMSKYQIYTILFIIMYGIIAFQYSSLYKRLIFGKAEDYSNIKNDFIDIIKMGTVLLFADMISNLILNLDRQFVSMLYNINTYSIYSFAYSMLKIVILAVSAIASVLYPTLKRMGREQMGKSYTTSVDIVSIISIGALLGYYPLAMIVEWWLPAYVSSLPIFMVLFPSISISSIISIIMINHYKALKKQEVYFWFSVIVLGIAFITNMIAQVVIAKPIGFSVASVLTMIVWYMMSDIYLCKKYVVKNFSNYIFLISMMLGYYVCAIYFKSYVLGFCINLVYFIIIITCFYGKILKVTLLKNKVK